MTRTADDAGPGGTTGKTPAGGPVDALSIEHRRDAFTRIRDFLKTHVMESPVEV